MSSSLLDDEELRAADAVDWSLSQQISRNTAGRLKPSSGGSIANESLLLPEDKSRIVEGMDKSTQKISMQQLNEAIKLLPTNVKNAYMTALTISPGLVFTESDPLRFLRYENNDPWAAASRLTAYWELRHVVFQNRAFLPLDLTGNGAMDNESIADAMTGVRAILPDDSQGRSVFYVDSSRRLHYAPETRVRSVFYFCQLFSENKMSQTDGIVVLFDESGVALRDKFSANGVQIICHCFPVRIYAVHVCCCQPHRKQLSFDALIEHAKLRLMGVQALSSTNSLHYHTTQDRFEMLRRLNQHGLTEQGIPITLGGCFSFGRRLEKIIYRRYQLDGLTVSIADSQQHLEARENSYWEAYLVEECRKLMHRAMNQMSIETKSHYSNALQHIPEIANKESNFIDFLRAENYHITNACRRLVGYWRLRSLLFESRAFHVVSQTAEGVLAPKDRDLLGTMFAVLLPSDAYGCPVVWIDTTAMTNQDRSVDRVLFYLFSVAAENSIAQKVGIVILCSYQGSSIVFDWFREIILMMPLQVHRVHILATVPCPSDVVAKLNFGFKPYIHLQGSMNGFGQILESYNLSRAHLPTSIGGSWGVGKFVYWQELRIRQEWGLVVRSKADLLEYPGLSPRVVSVAWDDKEKNRRMEVVHARRTRERMRVETTLLQEQVGQLQYEQTKLIEERNNLEHLLELVAKHIG